jgi:ABC-2 type transport system permease protein
VTGLRPTLALVWRRDRVQLIIWLLLFVAMSASAWSTAKSLYPSSAGLAAAVRAANGNPSLVALFGPVYQPTLGGVAMIKMVVLIPASLGLLTGLLVIRNTRADEESGRRELLGAAAIDRTAAPIAAVVETVGLSWAIGVLTAAALAGMGADATGSVVFGLLWALAGTVFAAWAVLCAQLTQSARAARGLVAIGVGAAYLLRAAGDVTTVHTDGGAADPSWVSWLSPLGWAQQLRPFTGDRWWAAIPLLVVSALLVVAAVRIAAVRDLGAGLLPVRAGRHEASRWLGTVEALTWRLHRGQLIGWTVGFFVVGVAFGGMGSAINGLAGSPGTREMLERLGGVGNLVDVFYGAEFSVMGMAAAALGVSVVSSVAAEETSGRAEYLLAAAVPRLRWYLSHLTVALVGTALISVAIGLGVQLTAGRSTVTAALGALPAIWVVIAIGALAAAVHARWSAVGWVVLSLCVVMMVADVLRLPTWVSKLSPFTHISTQPGAPVFTGSALGLVLIAAVVLAGATVLTSRRDLAG